MTADTTYTEKDIIHKEGIEAIRQNAAMYVGDTSYNGYHHLASEVIDNSIDEVLAGYATKVSVTIFKNGSCLISDDGRGIPSEIHPEYKISTLEIILSRMHSSGKYEKTAYKKYSSGLHGLGLKATVALSERLEATIQRDGKTYFQKYLDGKPPKSVEVIGKSELHGTQIHFKPSPKIFKGVNGFDREWFLRRLRDLAYLNSGVKIVFKDERHPEIEKTYLHQDGLSDYINDLLGKTPPLLNNNFNISVADFDGILKEDNTQDEMKIDLAFNYGEADSETILCYTNNVYNKDGGTHLTGFQSAFTTSFNNYLKKNEDLITKKDLKDLNGKALRGEDYRQGIIAVLSVKISRPQFAGQTKDRLTNAELQGSIKAVLGKALNKWIEENPILAKKILDRAIINFRAHIASKKAAETVKKDNKSLLGSDRKLKDCTDDTPETNELFIVEGDSAGGSCINGRNPANQAVLPLGGKILNTWKATIAKMLSHDEISSLIRSLGTGILDSFESEKCRYGKIIILTDADIDGAHIKVLLLTLFFQHMRKLIEDGKIYIAQPPLYRIQHLHKKEKCSNCGGIAKKVEHCGVCTGTGRSTEYIVHDSDFYSIMSKLGKDNAVLIDNNGKTYTKDVLNNILETCITHNKEKLVSMGFSSKNIEAQKTKIGEIPSAQFTLKNLTKTISITHLLKLPQAIIELGQNCVEVTRFKGLGEMGFEEIWTTTMNPKTRSLLQVKIEDVVEANNKFEMLMGAKADLRREFISIKKAY